MNIAVDLFYGGVMNSNNVIQFPGQNPEDKTKSESGTKSVEETKGFKQAFQNKTVIMLLIVGFSMFAFNIGFNKTSSLGSSYKSSRGLASVNSSTPKDFQAQFDFARKLASVELQNQSSDRVGRHPSSDDQIRHGVLKSKGYILTKNIENGNLISIQLQTDEESPAYLQDPFEFIEEHGAWINKDFLRAYPSPLGETIEGDKRVSQFILETRSGLQYAIRVERDLFQRLTSISQTEVLGHRFN